MIKKVSIILLFLANNLLAGWTEIGPGGGWITCMKNLPQNPQKIFCGVLQGGAFVSVDRGQNWSVISEIGKYNPVYDLSVLSDGTVYIASKQGLYISRNSGTGWEKILNTATWQVFALNDSTVAVDTAKFSQSYLKDRHPANSPWLISYNQGQNWQLWPGTADSSISYNEALYSHEKRGNMIVTAEKQVFRIEGLRIFKTANENWTEWQHVNYLDQEWLSDYCRAFLFTPDSGITFYAFAEYYDFHPGGLLQGGIFKSEDSWQNWTKVTNNKSATALAENSSNLFIGETDGEPYNTNSKLIVYNTIDFSSNQLAVFGGDIIAIDAVNWDAGELIVATESGIFKTQNYGENWNPCNKGIRRINSVAVQVLSQDNNKERIVLAVFKGGIWSSENDGDNWQNNDISPYVLPGLLQKATNHPQYCYAGGARIYRSSNAGDSWSDVPDYSFPAGYYGWYGRATDVAIDPNDPEHVFVHYFDHSRDHYRGIICAETFDYGNSWTEQYWFGQQYDYDFSWKAMFDSNRLWISHLGIDYENKAIPAFIVFDSTRQNPAHFITLPDSSVPSFWCVFGDTCYVINTKTATFFRSGDLGETWFFHDFGELQYNQYYWKDWAIYEPFGQLTLSPDKQFLFFVYPGTGVLFSEDKGETWKNLNHGLASLNTYYMTFSSLNPHIAYLATENGFYKQDFVSGVNWKKDKNLLGSNSNPRRCIVSQNYPNPFNPTTTIFYQLPKPGMVNISIYNVAGQLVETLVNEWKNAGYFSVEWKVSQNYISSGIYFYSIVAGDYSDVKKCILLR